MFDKIRQYFDPDRPDQTGRPPQPDAQPADSPSVKTRTRPQHDPDRDQQVLSCWSATELDGRRIEVFRPKLPEPPAAVVLFLHGHGQVLLSENLTYSRLFHQHNMAVVCPDGKQSWWLDVVCKEFDAQQTPQQWLINAVVPFIEQELKVSSPHIALMGVSMGGQGVLQLAYRYASRFPIVAAISPAVDFHQMYGSGIPLDNMFPDAESARQATVVLNLHPLAWPKHQFFCCDPTDTEWFDGCARLGMKLSSSGILHNRDLQTSYGGHSWEYFNHMADQVIAHIATAIAATASDQRTA